MVAERPTPRLTPRLLLGLALVGFGLLLTLDNLNVLGVRSLLRLWPGVLVGIGLYKLRAPESQFAGLVWIVIGSGLLLHNLGAWTIRFRDVWPVFLVLAGLYLVWQAFVPARPLEDRPDPASPPRVSALAIMAGSERTSNSTELRGGELVAVMGGCEVDLTQAKTRDGEAVFEVLAFMGGIEIRIPRDWAVVSSVLPVMGAFEDNTKPPAGGSTQRLVVRGLVVMGGVEVRN